MHTYLLHFRQHFKNTLYSATQTHGIQIINKSLKIKTIYFCSLKMRNQIKTFLPDIETDGNPVKRFQEILFFS